jgi:hypothetical protein
MGEQTMFDLNEQIIKWRSNLAQSQTLGNSDIDELESHLREEIENLKASNLSDEEAFLIATHRLGSTDSLAVEYEKINRGIKFRNKLSWIATGVLGYFLAHYLIGTVSVALAVGSGEMDLGPGIVVIVLKMLFWSMILLLCYQLYKGNFDNLKIRTSLSSFKNKCVFIAGFVPAIILLYIIILLIAAEIYSDFLLTEMIIDELDIEGLGLVWGCIRLVWSVTLPIIIIMLLIKLRRIDLPNEINTEC